MKRSTEMEGQQGKEGEEEKGPTYYSIYEHPENDAYGVTCRDYFSLADNGYFWKKRVFYECLLQNYLLY